MKLGDRSREVRALILRRVNELCEENHITYCELSNRLNLTSGAVYQWFHFPDRLPSLLSIIDMCDIFDLSLSEFFEENIIDKQTNIERRMMEGIRQLSLGTNERLLSLIEQLVKENNLKDRNDEGLDGN